MLQIVWPHEKTLSTDTDRAGYPLECKFECDPLRQLSCNLFIVLETTFAGVWNCEKKEYIKVVLYLWYHYSSSTNSSRKNYWYYPKY